MVDKHTQRERHNDGIYRTSIMSDGKNISKRKKEAGYKKQNESNTQTFK